MFKCLPRATKELTGFKCSMVQWFKCSIIQLFNYSRMPSNNPQSSIAKPKPEIRPMVQSLCAEGIEPSNAERGLELTFFS